MYLEQREWSYTYKEADYTPHSYHAQVFSRYVSIIIVKLIDVMNKIKHLDKLHIRVPSSGGPTEKKTFPSQGNLESTFATENILWKKQLGEATNRWRSVQIHSTCMTQNHAVKERPFYIHANAWIGN